MYNDDGSFKEYHASNTTTHAREIDMCTHFSVNPNNTDATRILDLFSGEKNPIPQITVYSIYLSKPTNVTFTVFNIFSIKFVNKLMEIDFNACNLN